MRIACALFMCMQYENAVIMFTVTQVKTIILWKSILEVWKVAYIPALWWSIIYIIFIYKYA